MEKDNELVQVHRKLERQELEIFQHQQQMKDLQQKYDDTKKVHNLDITKINNTLSSNMEEVIRLRNHNKTSITKTKKLKNNQKTKHFNEDFKGKILEKQEENCRLKNHNQELEERIKKLKDKKLQEETIKRIQNDNRPLEKN